MLNISEAWSISKNSIELAMLLRAVKTLCLDLHNYVDLNTDMDTVRSMEELFF